MLRFGSPYRHGRARGVSASASPSPRAAPPNWARMNHPAELGAMPAKVSVTMRPIVTAGLANDVDDVNQ